MHVSVDNEATIRDFCAAWSRLDADEIAAYFTEDAVYHNIPAAPIRGREAIREAVRGFSASWDRTEWQILALAAEGDTVFAERIDHTWADEDREVRLPVVGVFTMRDGRIAYWKDYFDMATYSRAMN